MALIHKLLNVVAVLVFIGILLTTCFLLVALVARDPRLQHILLFYAASAGSVLRASFKLGCLETTLPTPKQIAHIIVLENFLSILISNFKLGG